MTRRARAIAIARRRQPPSLLPWLVAALVLLAAAAAQAQVVGVQAPAGGTDGKTTPPALSDSSPAPMTTPGVAAATPQHGSTGVIVPPSSVDPGMPIARPSPGAFPTPTVKPPGSPGGNPQIQPK
jgi:hypothetical protein